MSATAKGTEAYRTRMLQRGIAPEHFRDIQGLKASTIGIGTYLGESNSETDELYE